MSLQRWSRLAREIKFRNPWWTYLLESYALPSGTRGEYHYVHTNGSSMVIPIDETGRILLVNQYRYLCDRESMEFPCGSVKDGSTHDETAWGELAEETGYSARELFQVGEFNPYNGVTDEMCRVYVARHLQFVGANPDPTEEFELVRLTPTELEERIGDGSLWDGMTIAAWGIAKEKVRMLDQKRDQ
jgi:8-oxo-dGTP pyrophosphatase MutT (NUDIX family)